MLTGTAEIIITQEKNALRFEKFCAEIIEQVEGVPFLTTSQTYDRSRDAIGLGRFRGTHRNVVLCTLEQKNLDKKVAADAERLSRYAMPDRIEYCCGQPLSQKHTDDLAATIRDIFPKASIAVKGAEALAQLAEKHENIFEKFYGPELRAISPIAQPKGISGDKKSLLLALATFSSEDAKKLRAEVSIAVILSVISEKGSADYGEIATHLTTALELPKQLNSEYIKTIVQGCSTGGLIAEAHGKWTLTDKGKGQAAALGPQAAEELLAGRSIIRHKLEVALGKSLPDQHFEKIWATLQDFLAELFYSNGLATIRAVNEMLSGKTSEGANKDNLLSLIKTGAAAVGATAAAPELNEELERAVLDIFTERSGDAFEWLARIAERFVAICALGLEATTADEIRQILRRYELVLDSDIILTYLCDGEPDHEAAHELLARWLELQGVILLAPTVLKEVAAHAWISDRSFPDTIHLLGKLGHAELMHYVDNAFVRAFHVHARSSADRERWRSFIRQYQGSEAEDYSNVRDILADELHPKALLSQHDQKFAVDVAQYLQKRAAERKRISIYLLPPDESAKLTRDGQLLAMIAAARDTKREEGTDKTVVLLSSSFRLRRADQSFRAKMGNPEAVISLSALSYLLSMLPETPLGASAMRRALFEFKLRDDSPDFERLAMQIIKSAGTYDIPLARRVTLRNELEKSIRHEAELRGVKKGEFEDDFEAHEKSVPYADIIGEAVREMSAKSPDLEQAQRRIRELEDRIRELEREDRDSSAAGRSIR